MIQTNIPVILLREIIVLPFNEFRIEFKTAMEKDILNGSEMNHDNYLLLVNLEDPLEENPHHSDLPKVAILGKIKSKIVLPNGIVKTVIAGIDRVNVINYFDTDLYLQAFVVKTKEYTFDKIEIMALKRVLFKSLEEYISVCPLMSNDVLGRLDGILNIEKIADIIASELPLDYQEKRKYIDCINPVNRIKLILTDLSKEIATVKMENDIELSLKSKLDEEQKKYFLREKIKVMKEQLGEISYKEDETNSWKRQLIEQYYPENIKTKLENEISKYEITSPSSPEIGMIRNYIEWMLKLPWNISTQDNLSLDKARKILEESHYGLDCVKERILEYIAVKKRKNDGNGEIICLVGPPGVGKTTLAKSIAKSMNKKFVKISVGGINDEAEIIGHRRTYVGSSPGKIINSIKKVGVNNPVFLIDEIDKMKQDYKGDATSCLLDILDKEQNYMFVDNYIEEEFDLSNVTFILTANNSMDIPSALRDRLEIINLTSYNIYEKINIAKNYLLPKLEHEYGIKKVSITDKALQDIIRYYTKEAGARELERVLRRVFRKIILNKEKNVIIDNVSDYLGVYIYDNDISDNSGMSGIVNALAYTPYGGEIFKVSGTFYKGNGKIITTGCLGEIVKESIQIALSYIKANYKLLKVNYEQIISNDLHIHLESGAISKDGPSAGIAIVTSLISLFLNKEVENTICMTGEITLRGKILPVGGIREKIVAASYNNIKNIFVPLDNKKDIENLEKYITKDLNIIFVDNYMDIYNKIF